MDELKEKIARAACSTALWPGSFEQETVGNKAYWRDVAQAALTAIEDAGFVLTRRQQAEGDVVTSSKYVLKPHYCKENDL